MAVHVTVRFQYYLWVFPLYICYGEFPGLRWSSWLSERRYIEAAKSALEDAKRIDGAGGAHDQHRNEHFVFGGISDDVPPWKVYRSL